MFPHIWSCILFKFSSLVVKYIYHDNYVKLFIILFIKITYNIYDFFFCQICQLYSNFKITVN